MRRMRKTFKRPKSPWNRTVIDEEKKLLREFGLKNKKEIWKARAVLREYRARAREITSKKDPIEEKILLDKLVRFNILDKTQGIDDVLALSVEDVLNRRLQTIIFRKNMTNTIKQARQLIVHGKVLINDRKVVFPSYFVPVHEENMIQINAEMQKAMATNPKKPNAPSSQEKASHDASPKTEGDGQ